MAQQTLTEKDQFLNAWNGEFQTTLRVLRAYPSGKDDYRPAEKSRTTRELAWTFIAEQKILEMAAGGHSDFSSAVPPPAPKVPIGELIKMYEQSHRELTAKIGNMSDASFNDNVKFWVAPKQLGDVRRGEVMWMILMDLIHHRGQFSVYLRLTGAKVPSIYGPTADEPWN